MHGLLGFNAIISFQIISSFRGSLRKPAIRSFPFASEIPFFFLSCFSCRPSSSSQYSLE